MRIWGYALLALGALTMLGSLIYGTHDHYTEAERLNQKIEAQSRAVDDHVDRGIPAPPLRDEDFPASVYSPERAENRQLGLMSGGALLLLGGIFVAGAGRSRRPLEEASPAA